MIRDILYSRAILTFIGRIKLKIKKILANEVGIDLKRDRFSFNRYSYPLKIVVIEHHKTLGYFDSGSYEIGINKQMMTASTKNLENLLRHELAHYLTWIKYGNEAPHHGKEFHDVCRSYGWDQDVYAATTEESLDSLALSVDEKGERILSKIKKLLALATSHHSHEAELATLKSNELLLKYNLSEQDLAINQEDQDEEMLLKRIFKLPKASAKLHAIAQILRTFFVETVFARGTNYVYLEIFGKKSNVAIAEHVGLYLHREFEDLWEQTRLKNKLKGLASKNSFFYGIAKGYCQKIEKLNQIVVVEEQQKGLIKIQKDLQEASKMAYPSLRKTVSTNRLCSEASQLGKEAGNKLHIKNAVEGSSKGLFLGFNS